METFHIDGLQDLERRLKALPEKIQRVTLIKACQAGAAPILAAAQAKVPRKTGLLARSIRVKFTRRSVSTATASVGVFGLTAGQQRRITTRFAKKGLTPTYRDLGDPYYALWVEKGHDIVRRGAAGLQRKRLHVKGGGHGGILGHVAPKPFLRPALDENAQRATDLVAAVLRQEIDRAERL